MLSLLALALVCAPPKVVRLTPAPWEPRDQAALDRAPVGCRKWVGEDACLTRFVRVVPGTYRAYCRRPR